MFLNPECNFLSAILQGKGSRRYSKYNKCRVAILNCNLLYFSESITSPKVAEKHFLLYENKALISIALKKL